MCGEFGCFIGETADISYGALDAGVNGGWAYLGETRKEAVGRDLRWGCPVEGLYHPADAVVGNCVTRGWLKD